MRSQGSQILAAESPKFKVWPFGKKKGSSFKVVTSKKDMISLRFKVWSPKKKMRKDEEKKIKE